MEDTQWLFSLTSGDKRRPDNPWWSWRIVPEDVYALYRSWRADVTFFFFPTILVSSFRPRVFGASDFSEMYGSLSLRVLIFSYLTNTHLLRSRRNLRSIRKFPRRITRVQVKRVPDTRSQFREWRKTRQHVAQDFGRVWLIKYRRRFRDKYQ